MAVANLIGTTIIPSELILEIMNYGVRFIGDVGCKTISFLSTTSISVSAFSLVVISVDRYLVMRQPTRSGFSTCPMVCFVILTWVLGFSIAVIYLIGDRIRLHDVGDISVCRTFAPYKERLLHTFITLSVQVIIPLLFMFVLYAIMVKHVKSYTRAPLLQREEKAPEYFRRDRIAVRILLLIVIVFFVCQLPVNIFFLFELFEAHTLSAPITIRLYTFLHMLQMASNCINPIIYFAFNRYLDTITEENGRVDALKNEAY